MKRKTYFTLDTNQVKNIVDLSVGIVTLTIVILSLTFGSRFNTPKQKPNINIQSNSQTSLNTIKA